MAEATEATIAELIAAAYLHDTLEDTATRYEDLVTQFGVDIAKLVAEVTDDKSLPKAERKRLQVETMTRKSAPRAASQDCRQDLESAVAGCEPAGRLEQGTVAGVHRVGRGSGQSGAGTQRRAGRRIPGRAGQRPARDICEGR